MTPANPVPPDAVGLRVEVSVADRDRLRVAAARAGQSMAAYVRTLIVERLDAIDAAEARPAPKRKR
jgi:hypothetical protein